MPIVNICCHLQSVRVIFFLLMCSFFALSGNSTLFAQSKPEPEVKTESSDEFGEGGKKVTTTRVEGDGQQVTVIETKYFDPLGNPMEKAEVRIEKGSKTTTVEAYDDKGKVKYKREARVTGNKDIHDWVEHFEDGKQISGFKFHLSEDGVTLEKFNPQTNSYERQEREAAEQYERMKKKELGETYFDQSTENYSKAAQPGVNLPGYKVETAAYTGIRTHTFSSPFGKIDVNLPDRIAPGDPITGSLVMYPAGKTKDDLQRNEAELKDFQLQLPDGLFVNIEAGQAFRFITPPSITGHNCRLSLFRNKRPLSAVLIQLAQNLPPEENFILPTGGQQGRYCRLRGRFNGRLDENDLVQIGEKPMLIVAESPRERVMLNEYESFGVTKIIVVENGRRFECLFRSIGLKMTADKLDLLRGESTTLHVQIFGLSGMTEEVPLALVNNTPAVIKMSEGDTQTIKINPGKVKPDGTFSLDRRLSSIITGSFGVTGTVSWTDTCIVQ